MQSDSQTATRAKKARPHKTIYGKVVYKRPKHEFGAKDVARIIRHMLLRDPKNVLEAYASLVFLVLQVTLAVIEELGEKGEEWFRLKGIPIFLATLIKFTSHVMSDWLDWLQACWNTLVRPLSMPPRL